MPVIPQRELRNAVSSILRRAERGERFTVTVAGRPVAEVGPLPNNPRPPADPARLAEILAGAAVDREWEAEVRAMRADDAAAARDPWTD